MVDCILICLLLFYWKHCRSEDEAQLRADKESRKKHKKDKKKKKSAKSSKKAKKKDKKKKEKKKKKKKKKASSSSSDSSDSDSEASDSSADIWVERTADGEFKRPTSRALKSRKDTDESLDYDSQIGPSVRNTALSHKDFGHALLPGEGAAMVRSGHTFSA